jgi:hypothetical protein
MMHAQVMYDLAKLRIADDMRVAARERLAVQARRESKSQGLAGESLLERLAGSLRRTVRGTLRPADGTA